MTNKDSQYARTLANGIRILEAFRAGETSLRNKDFAERTGMAPNTVVRLTYTLTTMGYLRQDPISKRYYLDAAILSAAYPLLAGLHLRQTAHSLMHNLASRVNGTVSLVAHAKTHMVYLETARVDSCQPAHPDLGYRLPMLVTAAGRAWLSRLDIKKRQGILNQLQILNPQTFAKQQTRFLDELARFQKEGFCASNAEWRKDTFGFAVPLSIPVNSQYLVFNCGVYRPAGNFQNELKQIAPQLKRLVQSIERTLSQ